MTTQRSTIVMSISATFGIAMLLSTSGCVRVDDSPQEPVAKDSPPKDAPARVLTKTEQLLVGTWKRVRYVPKGNPFIPKTVEYRADGTRLCTTIDWKNGKLSRVGNYSVKGDELTYDFDADIPRYPLYIDEISDSKLVISTRDPKNHQVEEFERVLGPVAFR